MFPFELSLLNFKKQGNVQNAQASSVAGSSQHLRSWWFRGSCAYSLSRFSSVKVLQQFSQTLLGDIKRQSPVASL